MKNCKNCGAKLPERLLYWLPKDAGLLADALHLPTQTVVRMLSRGEIPVRYRLDRLGRRSATAVWIYDALEAIKGLKRDNQ